MQRRLDVAVAVFLEMLPFSNPISKDCIWLLAKSASKKSSEKKELLIRNAPTAKKAVFG